MDKDHEELETHFDQLLFHIKDNSDLCIKVFSTFKQALQKHFKWEEKVLFPLFEKRAGLPGTDTIFVLKNEHFQITSMFINKIEILLSEKRYNEIIILLVGLEEMLRMHRKLETDIFYPWFDETLDLGEKESILKQLKNRKDN